MSAARGGTAELFRPAVRNSPDLDRVVALPRRPVPDQATQVAMAEILTERLGLGPRACACRSMGRGYCIDRLLPHQGWALWELKERSGLLALIGVGGGKTVVWLLAPLVVKDCRVAALLVPPGLVEQLAAEYLALREHFRVPSLIMPPGDPRGWLVEGAPVVHVVPYSRFSRPESTELLEKLRPDLVLSDEAHNLKNRQSARGARVVRYMCAEKSTRMAAGSASMTKQSVLDFAHLSAFSLGDGSPLPLDPSTAEEWAAAVDPCDWPAPAGALRRLAAPGEEPRGALARRIRETSGVVSAPGAGVGASLVLRERRGPRLPQQLAAAIRELRKTWERPDGEELVDALQVESCARQMICGFYYRWVFPAGISEGDVRRWFAARKAFGRDLREMLRDPRPHLDSPRLLAEAAERAEVDYRGDLPTWRCSSWPGWREVRYQVPHSVEAVWVDDYLARDAADWATRTRGVVWYEHGAFGVKVAELARLELHGGGPDAESRIRAVDGSRSIVASAEAHGTGRDGLQYLFAEQLVCEPPSSGDRWEQLLGRLHRVGQRADEVVTCVYRHAPEFRDAVDRAVRLAKYIQGITSCYQRLLVADVEWAL